jgi:HK97 family phage portal protein
MNLNPFRRPPENPETETEQRELTETEIIDLAFGFSSLVNGFNVTQESALTSNAVLACLIVRAETFASLPAHVYRQSGDSCEAVATPVSMLIGGGNANPLMTSREFWRWKQLTEDIRGQAHAWVERRGGQPFAIWPMMSSDVKLSYDSASREAMYAYGGDSIVAKGVYSGRDILHFRGPLIRSDYTGRSLVDLAKTTIGLTISSERFYDRLLANGNHFPGHLETDNVLKTEDIQALRDQFKELSGIEHAGELRIFDRGLKHVHNDMSIKDADLTAQQTWYLQEICRVFRVPPPLVQDWSHSTYTNSEQADLWFAKHTITPIATNTEAVINRLFARANGPDLYAKFELDGLLRGDYKTRAEGYSTLINCGVIAPNEARKLEDMNPYDGGEDYLRPLNMIAVGDDVDNVRKRIDAAGILVRSGYNSAAAVEAVGLPEIQYTDVQPVTVRPVNAAGVQIAPANAVDAASPLEPIRAEKVGIIRDRAVQDRERGRSEADTRAFAEKVIAPLAESYRLLGIELDAQSIITEAIGG